METTLKYLSDTKVSLTITVGALELGEAEQVALAKLSKTTKVPGFRAGKVPASIVAKHVDPNALQEQSLDAALNRAVAEAFVKEKLQPLDRPEVEKVYAAIGGFSGQSNDSNTGMMFVTMKDKNSRPLNPD